MSGWSGSISHIVRAMATAVSGSFEGVLMMASLRVTALRMTDTPDSTGLLPATMWTAREPKARMRWRRPSTSFCSTQPSRWSMPIVASTISRTNTGSNQIGSDR